MPTPCQSRVHRNLSTSENRPRARRPASSAPAKKAASKATQSKRTSRPSGAGKPGKKVAKPAIGKPAAKSANANRAGQASKPSPKPRSKRVKPELQLDAYQKLHRAVTAALEDLKARDTREIDVRGRTSVTDLIVVTSGTSTRHVKSIADEVVRSAKKIGLPPIGVEGQREAEWVLVDLGDIVVHVMLPRTREFYGLERLWTVGDEEHPEAIAG